MRFLGVGLYIAIRHHGAVRHGVRLGVLRHRVILLSAWLNSVEWHEVGAHAWNITYRAGA